DRGRQRAGPWRSARARHGIGPPAIGSAGSARRGAGHARRRPPPSAVDRSIMHAYRTHTCGELRPEHVGTAARLSGWVHRKRDHGNLVFVDLRDHYGITQCVIDASSPVFAQSATLRPETVVTLSGQVVNRAPDAINPKLPTGEIELDVQDLQIQGTAEPLPLQVATDAEFPEETRLRYRFLDLRREKVHQNIVLRSQVIASI